MAKVLVVDDELTVLQVLSELLQAEGHEVNPCCSVAQAIQALTDFGPDLVITDLYFEKGAPAGLEIVQRSREMIPPPVTVVITGFGSVETAVEAMKHGAFDYLEKPFKLDQIRMCLERALSFRTAVSETAYLRTQLKKQATFSRIVGNSPKMLDVFQMIDRVADTASTVLILGESGTGKELVAQALHVNSRRKQGPFIPVNCSALPDTLLESELFGHRRGAFTGAFNDKKGLFEAANGGTIFLDEVASMSSTLQSRLLRVLQQREVRRVGENHSTYVDVRVLAASNEPLDEKVKEGKFREDLFYRLNVVAIHLPPLRDRRDDIPLLVGYFLNGRVSERSGKPFAITQPGLNLLERYDWPGNVRELENAIERATILCEAHILRPRDFPPAILKDATEDELAESENDPLARLPLSGPEPSSRMQGDPVPASVNNAADSMQPLRTFLREQEQTYISRVIEQCGGNKEEAAIQLGISLATLYRKAAGEDRE
jgi:DNA-binding NtrC family response regulator